MRTLFVSVILGLVAAGVSSADDKEKDKKDKSEKTKLGVGDPAPKMKINKWLRGDAVPEFGSKNVYVVEFWATWCGPCIAAMPHLCELQEKFRDKGLVVVGVTSDGRNNSIDKVTKFVTKRGDRLTYAMAWDEGNATNDAFMKAAEQNGIPCSFVIDRAGKVAFIGHPLSLDDVLPKVLAGTWKGKEDAEAVTKALEEFFKEFSATMGKADKEPEECLKQLATLETKSPSFKDLINDQRVMVFLQAKKIDDAKALTEKIMESAVAKKNDMKLRQLSSMWSGKQLNPDRKHVGLALKAAEALVKINGDDDTNALLCLAEAQFVNNQKDKALATADKAMKSTDEKPYHTYIEKMIERFKEGDKEKDKESAKDRGR